MSAFNESSKAPGDLIVGGGRRNENHVTKATVDGSTNSVKDLMLTTQGSVKSSSGHENNETPPSTVSYEAVNSTKATTIEEPFTFLALETSTKESVSSATTEPEGDNYPVNKTTPSVNSEPSMTTSYNDSLFTMSETSQQSKSTEIYDTKSTPTFSSTNVGFR